MAPENTNPTTSPQRLRLRELIPDIKLGAFPPGPKNGITDVPGVLVSTISVQGDNGDVNTGVTTILPRRDWFTNGCHAGMFRYNGAGELTGSHWLDETGVLVSPIVLSNSYAVGACHQGIYQYAATEHPNAEFFLMPVVGETYDGVLNNLRKFSVTPEHVVQGIKSATADPVQEGNTGGGTGMICQGFKGGTGTASRLVTGLKADDGGTETTYTVAALVQANYGRMSTLHIAGVPVGRILQSEVLRDEQKRKEAAAYDAAKDKNDGSIIIVIATDAPLDPVGLQRLARRATGGLSRVGGYGNNTSGDVFMAFSTATANGVPAEGIGSRDPKIDLRKPKAVATESIYVPTSDPLLEAAADATEEAIYNVLCKAETMVGRNGFKMEAMPLDKVKMIVEKHLELEKSLSQ
jgi:D-aminopeptidase